MLVHPSVPAKDAAEFIAHAKANPGSIKMATAGKGSAPHVSGLLFTMMAGVDLRIVDYAGGGPALKDLIDGQVQMMFEPLSASMAPIRAGTLRPLAVTTATRSAALPDVPVLSDVVRVTRRAPSPASAFRQTRLPRSSTGSTARSMRPSPSPR